eukprot:g9827.t1
MAQKDREALVALYNATDGPDWKHNTKWGSGAPLRDWDLVKANNQGRVVELTLSLNIPRGHIPPQLGDLSKLEQLWLNRNNLTGPILPELGNLSNLQKLDLGARLYDSGGLTGPIPPELGNLAALRYFVLENKELSGYIPPELGALSELQHL